MDLVIEINLKIALAIEIKVSNAPILTKGNTEALKDLGNPPLLIITPSADNYLLRPNVQVCNVQSMKEYLGLYLKR